VGVGQQRKLVEASEDLSYLPNQIHPPPPLKTYQSIAKGRVVSGHSDALDIVQTAALERGALKAARLAVSGAFHTVCGAGVWFGLV